MVFRMLRQRDLLAGATDGPGARGAPRGDAPEPRAAAGPRPRPVQASMSRLMMRPPGPLPATDERSMFCVGGHAARERARLHAAAVPRRRCRSGAGPARRRGAVGRSGRGAAASARPTRPKPADRRERPWPRRSAPGAGGMRSGWPRRRRGRGSRGRRAGAGLRASPPAWPLPGPAAGRAPPRPWRSAARCPRSAPRSRR